MLHINYWSQTFSINNRVDEVIHINVHTCKFESTKKVLFLRVPLKTISKFTLNAEGTLGTVLFKPLSPAQKYPLGS